MKPIVQTSAAVLLVHAALVWLFLQTLASPSVQGTNRQILVASLVAQMPAPVLLQPPAQPKHPTTPAAPQAQRSAVQANTLPAVNTAMPSEAAASTDVDHAPAANLAAGAGHTRPAADTAAALILPSSDADYLHNPPPPYPRMSRRMGEQGMVLLRVFIGVDGRAEKAEIRTSSGYPRLDEAALATVQRWRYVPGQRAGHAEAMWFNVPIRFVLD